jgi:hypothetical protein
MNGQRSEPSQGTPTSVTARRNHGGTQDHQRPDVHESIVIVEEAHASSHGRAAYPHGRKRRTR